MLGDDLIAPVCPPRVTGTNNYFFNRNSSIYIQKMNRRLAKFSGFPFVPSSVEEVREMMKRQK